MGDREHARLCKQQLSTARHGITDVGNSL